MDRRSWISRWWRPSPNKGSKMLLTSIVEVRTITLEALRVLLSEDHLTFVALDDAERNQIPAPYVYVLADAASRIHYIGKSDAKNAPDALRAMSYPTWVERYELALAEQGGADSVTRFSEADLAVAANWSPIIRYAHLHGLRPYVASVADTDQTGALWEARLQGLAGILTGNESLIGGSAWEANIGTLRGKGYEWAWHRLWDLRHSGQLVQT